VNLTPCDRLRTLRVTRQTADAATKNAEIAAQALHLSERAYIAIVHVDLVPDGTSHEVPWHITITIERPSFLHSTQLEPLSPTAQRVFWGPAVAMPVPPGTVLWIYGEITYEDVFSKPHNKGFCMRCEFQPLPQLFPYYDARYVYET